jgi:hypothetical protein
MNTTTLTWIALPLAALAALNPAPAARTTQAGQQAWSALPPQDLSDAQAWRELLAEPQLELREKSFDALVARAAADSAEFARLEALAGDPAGGEFAWSCKLALREARGRLETHGATPLDPFEALRQRMFTDPFQADPFGGFMWIEPSQVMPGGALGHFQLRPSGPGVSSRVESFRLEMGPNGITARLSKKNEKGETEESEYTAKSIEELLAQHPELSAQLGHGASGVGATQQAWGLRLGAPDVGLDSGVRALRLGRANTEVLGVYISQDDETQADEQDGLLIKGVQPGSLASEMQLKPGQVLLEINGRALKSTSDISTALRERAPQQTLEVKLRNPEGGVETKTWTPSQDPRGKARPLEPLAPGAVRKI